MQKAKMPNSKAKKGRAKKGGTVNAPIAKSAKIGNMNPQIRVKKSGSIQITHRELLSSYESNEAFKVTMTPLNPGLPNTFPWLSAIANNYERYRFDKLDIVYEPSCPTTSAGMVFIAVDYDPRDPEPNEFKEVMSMHSAKSGPLWAPIRHTCTYQDLNPGLHRKTRRGIHVIDDLETYDAGNIILGNDGGANIRSGYVFLEYTVTLFTPQLNKLEAISAMSKRVYFNDTCTPAAPFGVAENGSFKGGLAVEPVAGNAIRVNDPGQYLIEMQMNGTTITNANPFLHNADLVVATVNAAANIAQYIFRADVKYPHTLLTFQDPVPAAAVSSTLLRIATYLYSMD